MNPISDMITVIAEQPQVVLGFVFLSIAVTAAISGLYTEQQGVKFHEELLTCGHEMWHLTWPKVDDEWTGTVNIVCDRCSHTEKVPVCWSLVSWV